MANWFPSNILLPLFVFHAAVTGPVRRRAAVAIETRSMAASYLSERPVDMGDCLMILPTEFLRREVGANRSSISSLCTFRWSQFSPERKGMERIPITQRLPVQVIPIVFLGLLEPLTHVFIVLIDASTQRYRPVMIDKCLSGPLIRCVGSNHGILKAKWRSLFQSH